MSNVSEQRSCVRSKHPEGLNCSWSEDMFTIIIVDRLTGGGWAGLACASAGAEIFLRLKVPSDGHA